MGWYDLFSHFYDRSLEPLYADARRRAADALALEPSSVVLDVPVGTGQSLDVLAPRVPSGAVIGVDASAGMRRRAEARVARHGWSHVHLVTADVHALDQGLLDGALGRPATIDRLHVFLGLSAFPAHEAAFDRLWSLLAPGGRCVIVDVHADPLTFQGKMVNLVARADIRRRTWEGLERVAEGVERVDLPSLPDHGGQLFLASGTKPR